jgi:hypothetical protein
MLHREAEMDYFCVDAEYHAPSDEAYSVSSGTMTPDDFTDSEDDFVMVEEEENDVAGKDPVDEGTTIKDDNASKNVSEQVDSDTTSDDFKVRTDSSSFSSVNVLTCKSH